jgi:hypothetical protein
MASQDAEIQELASKLRAAEASAEMKESRAALVEQAVVQLADVKACIYRMFP